MTWIALVGGGLAAWVGLSIVVGILFGQAVHIANRRRPRRPVPQTRRRGSALDRVVQIATGAIPIIRPAVSLATGAIPIIRPRVD
jgi:hypothetical protein